MGLFKEQANFLESLYKRQEQIWNDSIDIGIYLKDMTQDEIEFMRDTIKLLLDLPGSKISWAANKPAIQREYRLVIMWSRDDKVVYKVSYFKDRIKEFFMIDFKYEHKK